MNSYLTSSAENTWNSLLDIELCAETEQRSMPGLCSRHSETLCDNDAIYSNCYREDEPEISDIDLLNTLCKHIRTERGEDEEEEVMENEIKTQSYDDELDYSEIDSDIETQGRDSMCEYYYPETEKKVEIRETKNRYYEPMTRDDNMITPPLPSDDEDNSMTESDDEPLPMLRLERSDAFYRRTYGNYI